jgi:hypothetical protein
MSAIEQLSRRRVLRGMMQGAAVTVALPYLDCFLNANGTALAQGAPLRVRFAHWFFGNGITAGRQWWPNENGTLAGMKLPDEIAPLEAVKHKLNVFSKLDVIADGRPNRPHQTGWQGAWLGTVPSGASVNTPSVDAMISGHIGTTTRFRSLGASCTGRASTMSYLAGGIAQPNEPDPVKLYARIFGPEFKDPNSATFMPDPRVMARRSVLSAIKDERAAFVRDLGAPERARLDEYFTSLRQLERQVEVQLTKPEPLPACTIPQAPEEQPIGDELDQSVRTHRVMAQLLAHAVLCDQTRSINLMFSDSAPTLRISGDATTYHTYSHQEPPSGPEEKCSYFSLRTMQELAEFIKVLDSFKEGDGTLLDHMLVLATTDNGHAFTHQLANIPQFTAGGASGLLKTGMHVSMGGAPATRLGLTAMQLFKVPIGKFGTDSMTASRPIEEILT